jgi:hypothetical protein
MAAHQRSFANTFDHTLQEDGLDKGRITEMDTSGMARREASHPVDTNAIFR